MSENKDKGSNKGEAGSRSLTDSPYVGGNKMSSSLKDRLKRFRKYSSPISRPIQLEMPAQEYSKEEIENAMNEPESQINESACSNLEEIEDILVDKPDLNENSSNSKEVIEISIDKPLTNVNVKASSTSKEDFNESAGSDSNEFAESCIEVPDSEKNESGTSLLNDERENDIDKSGAKFNENLSLFTKKSFDNSKDGSDTKISDKASCSFKKEIDNDYPEFCSDVSDSDENESDILLLNDSYLNELDVSDTKFNENISSLTKKSFDDGKDGSYFKINDKASCSSKKEIDNCIDEQVIEDICSYSIEDIEKCEDKESLLEIFHGLQKEYSENQEKIRKLKLVQKHHTKNSRGDLNSLNRKWLACTQLALRKLYSFMPQPRSIRFETFLDFLQVDFDVVKYNPDTDSFE